MMPQKVVDTTDALISQMAETLAKSGTDLHDERQVLRALVAARFFMADIVMLSDQVVASAAAKRGAP